MRRRGNDPALAWINGPRDPAGRGVCATSPHWWSLVAALSAMLVQRVVAAGHGTVAASVLRSLATYALAAATTPDAVARGLALKALGGPLA